MSSSERPASPKQTLQSAGTEAGDTWSETLPTGASLVPTSREKYYREQKVYKQNKNVLLNYGYNYAVGLFNHLTTEFTTADMGH